MIVRPRPTFLQLFFITRGSIVPRILPQILGLAVYAAAVTLGVRWAGVDFGNYGIAPFGLLGVTLSLCLGFRNNAAYDRWWEARKLWGRMVYDIRNLSRAAVALTADETGQVRPVLMHALAFAHFLRGQLRQVDAQAQAARFVGDDVAAAAQTRQNPADDIMRRMGRQIGDMLRTGQLDPMGFRILDERLSALAAVQSGCERIAGTPLPFAYTLLLQRSAYIFCLLLPFGLASSAGWATPLFTALIAYAFFGLDALSEELEDPFGTQANDLALDGLCRVCEISVMEALGETPPPMMPADRYYFS